MSERYDTRRVSPTSCFHLGLSFWCFPVSTSLLATPLRVLATPVPRTDRVLNSTIWSVWGGGEEEESSPWRPWRGGVTPGRRINVMFGSKCVVHHARNTTTGEAAPPPTPYPHRLGSSPPGRLLKGNKGYSALFFSFFFASHFFSYYWICSHSLSTARLYIPPHAQLCKWSAQARGVAPLAVLIYTYTPPPFFFFGPQQLYWQDPELKLHFFPHMNSLPVSQTAKSFV